MTQFSEDNPKHNLHNTTAPRYAPPLVSLLGDQADRITRSAAYTRIMELTSLWWRSKKQPAMKAENQSASEFTSRTPNAQ